jgi:hypothetical protein
MQHIIGAVLFLIFQGYGSLDSEGGDGTEEDQQDEFA